MVRRALAGFVMGLLEGAVLSAIFIVLPAYIWFEDILYYVARLFGQP